MKNFSKQREEIRQVVKDSSVHPTAEDVYSVLRERISKISLSTVYRNLHLLAEEGILQKLYMPNGSLRFDGTLTPHQHAVCSICQKVFDVSYNALGLKEAVEEQTGMSVDLVQISILGVCQDCKVDEKTIW